MSRTRGKTCFPIATQDDQPLHLFDSSPKKWYRPKVRALRLPFSCKDGWGRDLDNVHLLQEENWEDIFTLPFRTTRETKLQSFGFKLINRLTPCAKYLHKSKKAHSAIPAMRRIQSYISSTCASRLRLSGEVYPNGANITLTYPCQTCHKQNIYWGDLKDGK